MGWVLTVCLKLTTAVLVLVVFLRQWRRGYFERIRPYLRSLKYAYYIKILLVFSVLTFCMFFFDSVALHTLRDLRHPFFGLAADFGARIGRGINPWLLMLGLYVLAVLLKRVGWSRVAFGALLSGALAALLSTCFKLTFLRARPNSELGPFSFFHWEGITGKTIFQSFPSGDVAVVAGMACFLFCVWKRWWGRWLLLILPMTTAFARVSVNRHWPSDTLFPFGLGLICAVIVFRYQEYLRKSTASGSG